MYIYIIEPVPEVHGTIFLLTSLDHVFFWRVHYIFGIDLYSLIPEMADHLAKDQIDMAVNWKKRYYELKENS